MGSDPSVAVAMRDPVRSSVDRSDPLRQAVEPGGWRRSCFRAPVRTLGRVHSRAERRRAAGTCIADWRVGLALPLACAGFEALRAGDQASLAWMLRVSRLAGEACPRDDLSARQRWPSGRLARVRTSWAGIRQDPHSVTGTPTCSTLPRGRPTPLPCYNPLCSGRSALRRARLRALRVSATLPIRPVRGPFVCARPLRAPLPVQAVTRPHADRQSARASSALA